MEKDGLQSAVDFTKYLVTFAGGGIAFVIDPTFYSHSFWLKLVATGALVLLGNCVISGLVIFSAGSVMLANGDYNIEKHRVKIPGLINIFSFAAGFVLLAITVFLRIWF